MPPSAPRRRVLSVVAALVAACATPPELGVQPSALAGGDVTDRHPAVVGLVAGDHVACTGVVIAPEVVVTAAHCPMPEAIAYATAAGEARVAVAARTLHPDHDPGSLAADLAFVRAAAPLPIAPLPIAVGAALTDCHVGRPVVMVGRGHTGPGGLGDHAPRAGAGTIAALDRDRVHVDGDDAALCAGDSGGALLVDDGGRWLAIGVAALGTPDCRGTSIFTRTDRWLSAMDERGLAALAPAATTTTVACASEVPAAGCAAGGAGAGGAGAIALVAIGALAAGRRRRRRAPALAAVVAVVAVAACSSSPPAPPRVGAATVAPRPAVGGAARARPMITWRDFARPPEKIAVATAGYPADGPATAPVTVVFAFDLRCAWSRRGADFVAALRAAHGDRVRIVYRNSQLQERHALPARALCAAARQARFPAMFDGLWRDAFPAGDYGRPRLRALAAAGGLDVARFEADLDGDACAAFVEADRAGLAAAGADTSPTFFINGTKILGLKLELLHETLTAELRAATAGAPGPDPGANR